MNDEAALASPERDDGTIVRGDPRPARDMRYAWVELSLVEARAIAAQAMLIVARSREVCLRSQRGLERGLDCPAAVVTDPGHDDAGPTSSAPARP